MGSIWDQSSNAQASNIQISNIQAVTLAAWAIGVKVDGGYGLVPIWSIEVKAEYVLKPP
ncbi:hypothetical protein ACN4EG_15870 [Alkalinema pantanalense CENA528]|uniref:hypothetical protein n=1 Tax=Alkalinema pantanalense TaxID=1620705 RepID=UPI003D6DC7CA